MAKEWAKKFYNSKAWLDCRESFIAERILADGGLCQRCKEIPGYIVHHKIMLNELNINNPEVTLNFDSLEFVCKDCHDEIHFKEIHGIDKQEPRYSFDAEGNILPPIKESEK